MSKFTPIMHLLDLKNHKIEERKFPDNLKPHLKQEVCIIPLRLCELNEKCADCMHSHVIFTKGKVDELGIGGWMSDQQDGLKKANYNPSAGIKLREPRTIIRAEGQVWACGHRQQRDTANFFLTENIPSCSLFEKKIESKEKKAK